MYETWVLHVFYQKLKGIKDSVLYVMRINLRMNIIYCLSVLMRK